jgi:integrase
MPLRITRRNGKLTITGTVTPAGAERGIQVRRRAGTDDPALAREEAAALERQILRDYHHGARRADRTWLQAAEAYLKHQQRGVTTLALIRRLSLHIGDAPLSSITAETADRARHALLRPGHAPATALRNVYVPLQAVLVFAHRRGWCDPPRFDLPQPSKGRTRFLMPAEFARLRDHAAPHLATLLTLGICTGCRAGEMLGMDWSDVDLAGGRAILWEGATKSGKRRVVHLPPAAVAALATLPHREGRVILSPRGEPYRLAREKGGGGQVKTALNAACRRAGIEPIGLHVLRHTWASWHYALHRDLVRLREDGRWASVAQVETYAHMMPAGHEAAIRAIRGEMHEARTDFRGCSQVWVRALNSLTTAAPISSVPTIPSAADSPTAVRGSVHSM